MREKSLGLEHLEVAASLNNLAVLLKLTGALEEAGTLYKRSIKIKESLLGIHHPQAESPSTVKTQLILQSLEFAATMTFFPGAAAHRDSNEAEMCKARTANGSPPARLVGLHCVDAVPLTTHPETILALCQETLSISGLPVFEQPGCTAEENG